MLIAVAGSQGSGKGTILEGLAKRGYKVIPRKTSRSILAEWGVTLEDVNNDPDLTTRFQDEITKRKWQDELPSIACDELILTERTHADLFTYALITLGPHNRFSEWVDGYFDTCAKYNKAYHHIIWVPAGMFPVQHDGVRGANQHYSRMADLIMLDATKRMSNIPERDISYISTVDIEARCDEAERLIENALR